MNEFQLARLCEDLRSAAAAIEAQAVVPRWIGARLADGLRDAGIPAPTLAEWGAASTGFRADDWKRLEILVASLREGSQRDAIAACLRERDDALEAFFGFCTGAAQLLTLDLLLKSAFRIEELARKWIDHLGGRIAGESASESATELRRLDYGGVLRNLEAADRDRSARIERLKAIEERRRQEEQEAYQRANRE